MSSSPDPASVPPPPPSPYRTGEHRDSGPHRHLHAAETPEGRILVALVLTVACMVVEVVGGWFTGSLALLSDAGHMLADAGALGLALVAQRVASQPRTDLRTYGFRRAETLAAFLNGITLGVTAVWIIVEAVERWESPPAINGRVMLLIATIGLVVNVVAAWVLSRGHPAHNANTHAALAHVLSDAAGSAAAILAGVVILAFGWQRADPLVSVLLAALILWSAWRLVARTAAVLMESTPAGLKMLDLERTIRGTPGVAELHDLHAWTISDGFDLVTVHVVLDGTRHGTEVAHDVSTRVREAHHIGHVTVQPEAPPVAAKVQIRKRNSSR
jgi:cobalt-zinc-cadmium efflux system protein